MAPIGFLQIARSGIQY